MVTGAAIPRQPWNGAAATAPLWYRPGSNTLGSTNKGSDYARDHPAGVVVMLYGTNDPDHNAAQVGMTSILDTIGSSKLIVLLNETPEGVDVNGTSPGSASAPSGDAFKAYSEWLSTLSYDSGHPNARPNVVVVDTWGMILDAPASGAGNWRAKPGYLRDGLHFTPWGARKIAELIHTRLTEAFGATYTDVAPRYTLPTQNGLTTPANVAPFVHTNPILTPGTNGSVLGSYRTAPLAANVPQGWWISSTGTTAGLDVVCNKTLTDSDGFPMWRITVSGELADNATVTLTMYQVAVASGQIANTDKVRGISRLALAAGAQGLQSCHIEAYVQSGAGAATNLTAIANSGSAGSGASGSANRLGYQLNEGAGAYDASGFDRILMTQLLDLANPDMATANGGPGNVTTISSLAHRNVLAFANYTGATRAISAQLDISRSGIFRTAN